MGLLLLGGISKCAIKGSYEIGPKYFLISSYWVLWLVNPGNHGFDLVIGPIIDCWSFNEGQCLHGAIIRTEHDLMLIVEVPIHVKLSLEVLRLGSTSSKNVWGYTSKASSEGGCRLSGHNWCN